MFGFIVNDSNEGSEQYSHISYNDAAYSEAASGVFYLHPNLKLHMENVTKTSPHGANIYELGEGKVTN